MVVYLAYASILVHSIPSWAIYDPWIGREHCQNSRRDFPGSDCCVTCLILSASSDFPFQPDCLCWNEKEVSWVPLAAFLL